MIHRIKPILLLCTLLLLTACSVQEKTQLSNDNSQTDSADRRTVKVIDIVDGDTIEYLEDGVVHTGRLIGINTLEYTTKKQLYGKEATLFLEELILDKVIEIEGDPNAEVMDKYNRYLIYAFIDGESVQSLLLSEGLARVAYLFDDYQYMDKYKEAECKTG